jgi:hypothetical protein
MGRVREEDEESNDYLSIQQIVNEPVLCALVMGK